MSFENLQYNILAMKCVKKSPINFVLHERKDYKTKTML